MKYLLLLFIMVSSINLNAQKISGVVIDSSNAQPVAFAVVSLKNTNIYCVTDSLGHFEIFADSATLKNDLNIYAMGYLSKVEKLNVRPAGTEWTMLLSPASFHISPIMISALSPLTIVKKMQAVVASSKMRSVEKAFYRQFHQENDKAVRLIEADLNVYWTSTSERITLNEMRRSFNYENNDLQHSDHLFDLLSIEPLHYAGKTVLNSNNINEYDFCFDRETDESFIIRFSEKKPSGSTVTFGKLVIEMRTFNLLSFELHRLKNPKIPIKVTSGNADQYIWDKITETIKADYAWIKDSVIIKSLEQTYFHNLINNVFRSIDYRVSESFSLFIYKDLTPFNPGKMLSRSSLYGRNYQYNADFWRGYTPPVKHPLDSRVIQQLQKEMPLEEQFEKAGKP